MQNFIIIGFIMVNMIIMVASASNETQTKAYYCSSTDDCNHGKCTSNTCVCDNGYITRRDDQPCSYEQSSQLITFLLSLFVGGLGVDWFILAKGNGDYIAAGVFKLLTGGGLGIWWLVDVIRLALNKFNDGNGMPLEAW